MPCPHVALVDLAQYGMRSFFPVKCVVLAKTGHYTLVEGSQEPT